MPVKLRLWDEGGKKILPNSQSLSEDGSWVVNFNQKKQIVRIEGVDRKPIVSSFLGLSAPVDHTDDLKGEESAILISCETDPYVKYIKARKCWFELLQGSGNIQMPEYLLKAFDEVLSQWQDGPELVNIVFA